MVSIYCVSASELSVLTLDILGVMISEEQNSEITKISRNLPIQCFKNVATSCPSDEWW